MLARNKRCDFPLSLSQVLDLLKENVKVNSLEGPCAVHALDWAEPGSTLDSRDLHTFNVVLAADVLYISDIVLPFVAVLQALLHPEGGTGAGGAA